MQWTLAKGPHRRSPPLGREGSLATVYFWRIENLKKDLIARPLTDREVLPYLLIMAVIVALLPYLPAPLENHWDYAEAIWSLLLAVAGTLYLYWCNGATAGSHFLQRYVAIGWVVAVRWIVALIAAFVVLQFFLDISGDETTPALAIFLMIAEVVLYERIGHHIRFVASASLRPDSTVQPDAQDSGRGSP